MQSLNRLNSDRPRKEYDFYETPYELCKASLQRLKNEGLVYPRLAIDAGAGRGVWGMAFRDVYGLQHSELIGIELQPNFPDASGAFDLWLGDTNYFDVDREDVFGNVIGQELIFGNPPYSLAEEFVRKSLELVDDGGYVFFLLRLAFLESKKRHFGLYADHPLRKVYVLTRRPSFFSTKEGSKTVDALAYGMFFWQKGWSGTTELSHLYWSYNK